MALSIWRNLPQSTTRLRTRTPTEGSENSVISIHYPVSLNSLIVIDHLVMLTDIAARTAVYDYESPNGSAQRYSARQKP